MEGLELDELAAIADLLRTAIADGAAEDDEDPIVTALVKVESLLTRSERLA
jgi:hypothetical protein